MKGWRANEDVAISGRVGRRVEIHREVRLGEMTCHDRYPLGA